MVEVSCVRWVRSCSLAIGETEIPDLINVLLVKVERIPAGWHLSGWGHDVTEVDIWVGELGAKQTIHVRVVAADLEVTPEHLDRVIATGIHGFEGLLGGHNDIDDDVSVIIAHILALVDN